MVDRRDLKSLVRKGVRVRIPLLPPNLTEGGFIVLINTEDLVIGEGLIMTTWEEDGKTKHGIFRAEDLEKVDIDLPTNH